MDRHTHMTSAVQAQVAAALPGKSVERIIRLPSADQHPLHRVELADGTNLMLSGPALPNLSGTAISSYSTAQAEAVVLSWLNSRVRRQIDLDRLWTSIELKQDFSPAKMPNMALDAFIPRPVKYFEEDSGPVFFGPDGLQQRRSAYHLTVPSQGTPVPLLDPPLNSEERQSIDLQSGRLLRMLAGIQSPTGRFGLAAEVLSGALMPSDESSLSEDRQSCPAKKGHRCWSDAFEYLLLEAREEASKKKLSSIPFARLHKQFERFRSILDHVLRPSLVSLWGGDDLITLAQRIEEDGGPWTAGNAQKYGVSWIRLTGFRDWSSFVFGDPLIARALCMDASREIVTGFTGNYDIACFSPELPAGLVDDRRHVQTRLLLYRCYWNIRDIIRKPTVPYIKGVQAAAPSPAWRRLLDTLGRLEGTPSPRYSHARRLRKFRIRKNRRSESPPGSGVWRGQKNSGRSWLERRRCATP